MLKIINQKGFAVIETVLVIIIIGVIGGTGYYVYHASKQTDKTLASGNSSSGKPSKTGKKKPKQAAKPAIPAVTDDTSAILAAIKTYMERQTFTDSNGQPITFTYTVDAISGTNAKGSMRASEGDPLQYVAQKQNGSWQIVYTSHLLFTDTCTKYNLPSDWCMSNPS